jgi:hypothetical protein
METRMAAHGGAETLADLVAGRAGAGRQYTFVALSERSIDPESGYRPSANLLWKVAKGESVKVNPELIRAIAQGLGLSIDRVARAATLQFIGYVVDDPFDGHRAGGVTVHVVHEPGSVEADLPMAQEFVDEVLRDDGGDA